MRKSMSWLVVATALLLVWLGVPSVQADVTLPKVLSSHMVLQRERPLPIWGWADPGEEVTVRLDDATTAAKADAKGNWKVVLPVMKADGKAHRMAPVRRNGGRYALDQAMLVSGTEADPEMPYFFPSQARAFASLPWAALA